MKSGKATKMHTKNKYHLKGETATERKKNRN